MKKQIATAMLFFGLSVATAQAMPPDWTVTQRDNRPSFDLKLNEHERQYRNTGTLTLRDPIFGITLGTYKIATGGFGHGSAPFGTYKIGRFRDPTKKDPDPKNIGKRWMLKQVGQEEDGDAYDHKLSIKRTAIELHRLRFSNGTAGCIGVGISPENWDQFVHDVNYIISQVGEVTFNVVGNPEATPNDTWNPFGNIVYKRVKHAENKQHAGRKHNRSYTKTKSKKYVSKHYGRHRKG